MGHLSRTERSSCTESGIAYGGRPLR